jgi:DNA-directed RNA polymerase subunit RPC12/RpoP
MDGKPERGPAGVPQTVASADLKAAPSWNARVRVVFVGRDRPVWKCLVLYIVTFGIWRRIWLYRVNKELDGHQALGLRHGWNAFLACLPVGGPAYLTFQTARRTKPMLEGSVKYGPWPIHAFSFLIPVLGTAAFIAWTQSRLNLFWPLERKDPKHGIDIDVGLEKDPAFLVEIGAALRESYHPGSRFDQRKKSRKEAFARRRAVFEDIRRERAAVRAAGGSTPLWPLARPKRPQHRLLHVTCGRCETRFDVEQDPAADTPIVCPKCGQTEVLPSLHSDPLATPDAGKVPTIKVGCSKCKTRFNAVRNLYGPTRLTCPNCGRTDTLPAPERVVPKGKAKAA